MMSCVLNVVGNLHLISSNLIKYIIALTHLHIQCIPLLLVISMLL